MWRVWKEHNSFRTKWSPCVEKLSHLPTRNVKRINTHKNHVALFKQTVASQEEKIENFKEEAKELSKNPEEALRVGVRERKKRCYWRDYLWKSDRWLPSYDSKTIFGPFVPNPHTRPQSSCRTYFLKTKSCKILVIKFGIKKGIAFNNLTKGYQDMLIFPF